MLQLFSPVGKVQKDRIIMRETDERMAKYSRRGLIFNFVAFLICLVGGEFVDQNKTLTFILTAGLLFITLLRAVYLFRFDVLYPRGPARWRNQYFLATLLGAFWWAVILCSATLLLKMQAEAAVFWLYTVIFFTTTAHAFAPYKRFLGLYQFIGLIPGAIAACMLFTLEGYLYSLLIFALYFMLLHQSGLVSQNYWDKLENEYVLSRKTGMIEEEKRDTQALSKLSLEFIHALHHKYEVVEQSRYEGDPHNYEHNKEYIHRCLADFNCVFKSGFKPKKAVFNIRHELAHTVSKFVEIGEKKGIEVESSLSSNLPMRLRGDACYLSKMINSLMNMAMANLSSGIVIIEADYFRDNDTDGQLHITISQTDLSKKASFFSMEKSFKSLLVETLDFYVAKGIASVLGGKIDIVETPSGVNKLSLNIKLEAGEPSGKLDFHRNLFRGRNVLVVHNNAQVVDIKRRELESLGFNVLTETQYERAEQRLVQSHQTDSAIESVIFYASNNDAVDFNNRLIGHDELVSVHQLIVASLPLQQLLFSTGFAKSDNVHLISRPAGFFELECAFLHLYDDVPEYASSVQTQASATILYYTNLATLTSAVQKVVEPFRDKLVLINSEQHLLDYFNENSENIDLILLDTDQIQHYDHAVNSIRERENTLGVDVRVPIVGLADKHACAAETGFERGIDDFIVTSQSQKETTRLMHYWINLHCA